MISASRLAKLGVAGAMAALAVTAMRAQTPAAVGTSGASATVTAVQAPAPGTAPTAPLPSVQADPNVPEVTLTAGRSLVLPTSFDITRIAITDPATADAVVVAPREILIDGKAQGTVSLIVWGANTHVQYDIVIDAGVSQLQQQLALIFPGEHIQVNQTADAVILTGRVSNNDVSLRAEEVADAMSPKAKVVNMLQLPSAVQSQQVLLQVRVAEVNRHALTQLGTSLFTGATGYKNVVARATTEQFPAPTISQDSSSTATSSGTTTGLSGTLTFSDFLNLFVFSNKYNIGTLIQALETTGNLQSLAEPNLIAYNGQEASFLAGGEIPVPIVQGVSGQVTIQYKEFGIRLTFTPRIAGDVIRLKVNPEVSSLDFADGVTLNGFRVPALTTRRASTDVELLDGQSFAIAGLMNNITQDNRQAIPLLSRLPIIGVFFKSKAVDKQQTELMVLVTPHLVRPMNPDEVPPLPTEDDLFLPPGDRVGAGQTAPNAKPAAPATR